jgi:hypothetical protein
VVISLLAAVTLYPSSRTNLISSSMSSSDWILVPALTSLFSSLNFSGRYTYFMVIFLGYTSPSPPGHRHSCQECWPFWSQSL